MGKDENWMMILTNSHHHHYGRKMLVNCANTGNDDFERMINYVDGGGVNYH